MPAYCLLMKQFRFLRYDQPGKNVGKKAATCKEQGNYPCQTDNGRVYIKIITESAANAGKLLVGFASVKSFCHIIWCISIIVHCKDIYYF